MSFFLPAIARLKNGGGSPFYPPGISGDPESTENADWSEPAFSPPTGNPMDRLTGPAKQPNITNDVYMPRLQQAGENLESAYAAPHAGLARQIIGSLFTHHPQIGSLISGEGPRQRNIDQAQQEYGLAADTIAKQRAAEQQALANRKTEGEIADTASQQELRDKQAAQVGQPNKRENIDKTVETAEGVFQFNPETNRYDIRVGAGKAAKPATLDEQLLEANNNKDTDTANRILNTKRQIAAATRAPEKEPGSYVPVPDPTDPEHKILGWVDPKSKKMTRLADIPGMADNNAIKPTGQAASREEQADVISKASDGLIATINKHRDKIGNVEGILKSAFLGTPIADPDLAGVATEIGSYAALQPAMHGFRGTDALREFEKIIGGIPKNPDALISSINAIKKTAGYFSPNLGKGENTGAPQPTHRFVNGQIVPVNPQ